MNRWVFHMHRDRMPVWCTCDHTRALMSSDLYMSIRISSESPLKIAWMRGGCGDEKEQSRDHYGRYKRLWSFPRYEVLPMCAVLKAAACTKTADCTQKKCRPSLTSYISCFSVRQRNYCGKFLVDTHHKNKKGLRCPYYSFQDERGEVNTGPNSRYQRLLKNAKTQKTGTTCGGLKGQVLGSSQICSLNVCIK